VNDNQISVHWSDLPEDELIRFWQDVDAGTQGNFLTDRSKNGPAANAVNIPQKPNVRTRPGSP
jgi:hypothetical protein